MILGIPSGTLVPCLSTCRRVEVYVSVNLSDLKIKLAHARQQMQGTEDLVEREYWRRIADHWLELLRASAGDNDDQIN
jgi:glutamyl-tRNA reductase